METIRKLFWPLLILAVVALVNCGLLVTTFADSLFVGAEPQTLSTSSLATQWNSLPVPVRSRPQWTSFTHAGVVYDVAVSGEVVWAATGGGVVVWERTAEQPHMVKFTTEHGLPSNQTTAVTVSGDGTVWVGTADAGAGRYDGVRWSSYTTAEGLLSNMVQDIAIDVDNTVLVATPEGINRFDPLDGTWSALPRSILRLDSHNARALQPTAEGLWVATDRGVERFDGRQWALFTTSQGLPSNDVRDVTRTADGFIWVATAAGLAMYDGVHWNTFGHLATLRSSGLVSVTAAGAGIWLGYGDGSAGVTYFALNGGSPVVQSTTAVDGQLLSEVRSVAVDVDDTVWIGAETGLYTHQAADNQWQAMANPSELPTNQLTDVQLVQGVLWGRTAAGLSRYDGVAWVNLTAEDGLLSSKPAALAADPAAQLWVAYGSPNVGFSRLLEAGSAWQLERCANSAQGHIFASSVVEMVFTTAGDGWLIAHDGVFRLRPGEGQLTCEFFSHSAFTQPRAAAATAETLFVLAGKEVWQADGDGLQIVDKWRGQGGQFKSVTVAPDGGLWLAADRFLTRFEGQEWQEFPLNRQVVQGVVRDLAVASNLTLWLATDEGVAFYNGRWRLLTTADGLASNDVYQVILAGDGAVWLVTAGGVSRYYPT